MGLGPVRVPGSALSRSPIQGEIVRARLARDRETLAVVVSCGEANACRSVVTLCELREDLEGRFRGLPTVVELAAKESGLERDLIAIASPYTVPKSCLVKGGGEGHLAPSLYREVEAALKRVLGWEPWPD